MSNRKCTLSIDDEQAGPEGADAEALDISAAESEDASASEDRNEELSDQETEEERKYIHSFKWQRPKYDTKQSPYGHFKRQYNRTLAGYEI